MNHPRREPGRRQRAEQVEQTRARLLDSAERLFVEHGVFNVSNRQISEAAGQGNVTAVSYHFEGKTELVRAIVVRHAAPMERIRRELLDEFDGHARPAGHQPSACRPTRTQIARRCDVQLKAVNRQSVLARRPVDDFRLQEGPLPAPGDGDVLARSLHFGLVAPMRGRDALRLHALGRQVLEEQHGLDYLAILMQVNARSYVHLFSGTFDLDDEDQSRRAYDASRRIILAGAAEGYGEYRAHLTNMDLAAIRGADQGRRRPEGDPGARETVHLVP